MFLFSLRRLLNFFSPQIANVQDQVNIEMHKLPAEQEDEGQGQPPQEGKAQRHQVVSFEMVNYTFIYFI